MYLLHICNLSTMIGVITTFLSQYSNLPIPCKDAPYFSMSMNNIELIKIYTGFVLLNNII